MTKRSPYKQEKRLKELEKKKKKEAKQEKKTLREKETGEIESLDDSGEESPQS